MRKNLISTGIFLVVLFPFICPGQVIYPDRIFADSTHAPFYHGIASGDPTASNIILWTRITPAVPNAAPLSVNWQIATDSNFTTLAGSGTILTDSLRDWTVHVDAGALQPRTRYYYRFSDGNGNYSATGRTKTAPNGSVDNLRMTLSSCSSIYSGYFNAYRRIGERDSLDLVVHVGDYVYDYADPNELVRVPSPQFPDPSNLAEWRHLHNYYCLDPDFRFAKQQHPWAVLWDNHDLSGDSVSEAGAIQAWYEWTPVRMPDSLNPRRIYRTLHYGDLADLFIVDAYLHRDDDTLLNGAPSMIGNDQWAWLSAELSASNAKWKLIANEDMFAQFSLASIPSFVPFGDGPVLDSTSWDGYGDDRKRVLDHIESNGIDNVIVLSGDSHIPFAADLDQDPWSAASYDDATGVGAVAVEMLGGSITRGNVDELGFGWATSIIEGVAANDNPHHVFTDFTEHGYGLLDMKADSAVGEFWFSDILSVQTAETFEGGWVVKNGANHWGRTPTTSPTGVVITQVQPGVETNKNELKVYPNPAAEAFTFTFDATSSCGWTARLLNADGRTIASLTGNGTGTQTATLQLPATTASGLYLLRIETCDKTFLKRVVVE